MGWRSGILVFLLTAGAITGVAQDGPSYRAGYQVLRIEDTSRTRPIQLDVWYPTAADEAAHEYGLSRGRVARSAAMATGRLPVAVMSHGALGAASNYSWIAERLARAGFLAIGVSHFGESPVFGPATVDAATVADFGARTRDLTVALDFVLERSPWAAQADGARVAALGHSSGGATVSMLAGASYRPEAMGAYCGSSAASSDRGCRYPVGAPAGAPALPVVDRRVRAIVLLDPAVGPAIDLRPVASAKLPALVVGSIDNDFLPFASHAGRYAVLLPQSEVVRLASGEGHFVYIDECALPIEAMGVPLCSDRPGVVRRDVHARLAARILEFLQRGL